MASAKLEKRLSIACFLYRGEPPRSHLTFRINGGCFIQLLNLGLQARAASKQKEDAVMKRIACAIALLLACSVGAAAQNNGQSRSDGAQASQTGGNQMKAQNRASRLDRNTRYPQTYAPSNFGTRPLGSR